MDGLYADAKESRRRLASDLDGVRREILERSTSFEEQFSLEMRAARRAALNAYDVYHHAAAAGVTVAEFAKFVVSDAFAQVPIVYLEVSLLTRVMTANATRRIRPGDVTDVDAMATYLPYCDIYGADRFMAEVARSLDAPAAYGCRLFDSRKDGVARLTEHLHGALAGMAPVNTPALSIFVAPHESIKENAFSLFYKLGQQSKKAESHCGLWVEVFGFDDGRMPRYEMRQMPGVEAPFFGLQEVVEKRCKPNETRESLLEACRGACRSDCFLFIDVFRELPDDFVMSVFATPKDGQSCVLGYQVHRRSNVQTPR
jgi:hypothetical protein